MATFAKATENECIMTATAKELSLIFLPKLTHPAVRFSARAELHVQNGYQMLVFHRTGMY